jgi:hypothetical protein
MVSQVKVVAVLMIVWGAISTLVGLLIAGFVPFMMVVENSRPRPGRDDTGLTVMLVLFLIAGLIVITVGILHVIAGIRCLKFRGRVLAMVALFSNIPIVLTFYCSMFAIGMAVYGLVVMFNSDVARAFEMADQGVPPEDIEKEFAVRNPYRRRRPSSDYWDRPDDDDFTRR